MKLFKISDKNELIQICMIYRYASLAISTLIYFFMCNGEVTPIRLSIAIGVISASIIGAYLYKKNPLDNAKAGVVITMCLEVMAYGLFIFVSGGFSSPYLWYFISSLTIVMAAGRYDNRIRIATPVFVAWGFVCALAGDGYGLSQDNAAYLNINTGIAFLVVAVGFYILFVYVGRLDKNQQELNRINESLKVETTRSEQALQHTMDIYESFNLFSITDPGKVMDEIMSLLCRTIAPGGCLLLKINLLHEIESIGCRRLSEYHETALIEHVKEFELMNPEILRPDHILILGSRYSITYISNPSGIQGILIIPFRKVDAQRGYDMAQESFYLNLVGIIMQELDLQAMVESYIVSEEQNRIANEIHDTVIQKLFSIDCNLRLLDERQGDISANENREQLKRIAKAVESTMRELREAIYDLRWDTGEQDMFADKLAFYMDEVTCLSGADINLILDSNTQFMTANQKTTFYRIICEAVNNAIHHGKATKIDIQVGLDNEKILAEISDNGEGFDQHRPQSGGQGLKNMYRTANLLKGQLSIESQIGKGTTIRCSLPK